MLDLLPQVDAYIKNATGRDWTTDETINPTAKAAARMLLVKWHEDPGMNATQAASLAYGLTACLVQLEAMKLHYVEFRGLPGAGAVYLPGARIGDTVRSVTGLIGVTGNQAAAFESVITFDDYIQQVSNSDLYTKWFRVYLVPVENL
jgi:hypothetical protein